MVSRRPSASSTLLPRQGSIALRSSYRSVLIPLGVAVPLLFASSGVVSARSSGMTPIAALARAVTVIEAGSEAELAEANALLTIAAKDESIHHWVELTRAKLLNRRGRFDEALSILASLAAFANPAAFDARALLAELGATLPVEKLPLYSDFSKAVDQLEELEELERELRFINRRDIIPRVVWVQAVQRERSGRLIDALEKYLALRRDFPAEPCAKLARIASERLRNHPNFPPAPHRLRLDLDEALILLREGNALQALSLLQAQQEVLRRESNEFFETRLVEEQVLRKLGRPREADHLLLYLSSHGTPDVAAKVLLRGAKMAWNANDYARARDFLNRLEKRFPTSHLSAEAKYITARINEETNAFPEAQNLYRALASSTADVVERLRALRRIAWLYLRNSTYLSAAHTFDEMRLLAEGRLRELVKQRDEHFKERRSPEVEMAPSHFGLLREERHHAMFWLGYALEKIPPSERGAVGSLSTPGRELWRRLADEDRYGYYGLLSRRFLYELAEREVAAQSEHSKARLDTIIRILDSESPPLCRPPAPRKTVEQVRRLGESGLIAYARAEADDYVLKNSLRLLEKLRDGPLAATLTEDELGQAYRATRLYSDAGDYFRSISLARSALRFYAAVPTAGDPPLSPVATRCFSGLFEAAHPLPRWDIFQTSSQEYGVPEALLFAISRSESFFDPRALSRSGAQGLMQLMPETAKDEGLRDGESLFDPAVNVRLGSKHLARLLDLNGKNEVYAAAAYNAGSSAVNRWRKQYGELPVEAWVELISYPETASYVKNVVLAAAVYRELLEQRKGS